MEPNNKVSLEVELEEESTYVFFFFFVQTFSILLLIFVERLFAVGLFFLFVDYHELSQLIVDGTLSVIDISVEVVGVWLVGSLSSICP
jgi:hypothetical protein